MAQYSLQGVYSFAQPQFTPAKPSMVAPADPKSYNADYLPQSRFHRQETPIPHAGRRAPPPHSDLLGPSAAKASVLPLKPIKPDPFAKYGRMRFESAIPAPVETSAEYKVLPFKADAEVNFADQNETPPSSIFSNMAPLELVERLIKGVTDPEKKDAFEAVRTYLMRMELVKATRGLTQAEDTEYGQVVNGLRANALDAFGDGSTQFATQVSYDLGIRFGLMRSAPPAPAPPGIAAPVVAAAAAPVPTAAGFMPGAAPPVPSMFLPPALPAPVPGPGIAPSASSSSSTAVTTTTTAAGPTSSSSASTVTAVAPHVPSDAEIDAANTEDLYPVLIPLTPVGDEQEALKDLFNSLDALQHLVDDEKKHGGITASTQKRLSEAEKLIKETAKGIVQEYLGAAPSVPSAQPSPALSSTPGSAPATPLSSSSSSSAAVPSLTLPAAAAAKAKKSGIEVKLPPEVRVMIALDYLSQTTAKAEQRANAKKVIDNAGNTQKDAAVKNAWDSLRRSRNKLHADGTWEGQWYSDQEFEAAHNAKVAHPSALPKQAAPGPTESKTDPQVVGSGLSAPTARGSFLGNSQLRRGFNLERSADFISNLGEELGMSPEWNPASW